MMEEFPCAVCAKECHLDTIQCSNCKNWVHRACSDLTVQDLKSWSAKNLKFVCKCCAFSGINYDASAALARIQVALSNKKAITNVAKSELKLLSTYGVNVPVKDQIVHSSTEVDQESMNILELFHPMLIKESSALKTVGDGNCLYRAISLALCGDESQHTLVRLLTSIELILNRRVYEKKGKYNDFIGDIRIVTSSYPKLVSDAVSLGAFSEMAHIYAASAAIGKPIKSYYPPQGNSELSEAFSRHVYGRGIAQQTGTIVIMWTMMKSGDSFKPNHFVPLVNNANIMNVALVNKEDLSGLFVDDSIDPLDCLPDSVTLDDSDPSHIDESDTSMLPGNIDVPDSPPVMESTNVTEPEADPFADVPSDLHGVLDSGFLSLGNAVNILLTRDSGLDVIPPGLKEDCFFVIDNTKNTEKRGKNKRSSFCDDCGIWDTKSGASPKTYYTRSESGHLTNIYFRGGIFCSKKEVKGKREYIPMNPQPVPSQVVVVHRYYTSSKLDPSYKKRVTWLGEGGLQSSLAIVEYIGKFPGLLPHSNSKDAKSEYTRTPAHVLEEVISMTDKHKPNQIYQKLKNKYDEMTRPSGLQQIYDAQHRHRRTENESLGHPDNVADQFTILENMVSEGHSFVRSVVRTSSRPPVIMLYTDEQLTDLRNLCFTGQTYLNVDKTFMLCKMHVTVLCYKQLTVDRRRTGEPPIFIGPMFLHDNSDYETYSYFFHHLKLKLPDVDVTKLVVGTDDEKALVKAISNTFPESTHVLCTRHLKENTRQKLTDDAVTVQARTDILNRIFGHDGIVNADDTICFESKCEEFEQYCSEISENFVQYFRKRLKTSLKDKVNDPVRREVIQANWTNNNCESINHVLKQTTDWKTKPFTQFVQLTHELVDGQFKELRSALIGKGEFRLAQSHRHFQTSQAIWMTMTVAQRDNLFARYRRYVTRDSKYVISTDGRSTVVAPRTNGRKPGERKRPVNVRTKTIKRQKTDIE